MKPFEPSDSLIILAIVVIVLISILTGCSSPSEPSEPSKAIKQLELEAEIHSMKDKLDKGITPVHDDSNCHIPH